MNKYLIALGLILVSTTSFANQKIKCEPNSNNAYFTETVGLEIVSPTAIKVNRFKLTRDDSYKPRKPTQYKRYIGNTDAAADWSDSGFVSIYFDGQSKLKFTISGEMFVSETFRCR